MSFTQLHQAEQRRVQTERVRALVTNLRALIEGRMTRAEVLAWTRELWPPESGQGSPFTSPTATSVFDSIWNLDERCGDGELVREVDLRAYLRWLCEGECFRAEEQPVIGLERDIEEFAAQTGTEAIRWWLDGLGWWVSLQFCAPARGRPFMVHANLKHPTVLALHKQKTDTWNDAVIDLFEALAIDECDVSYINPQIDLGQLPAWALWRQDDNANRFEIARFHSYAKAYAQERMFTARGHRQTYWVDPAT